LMPVTARFESNVAREGIFVVGERPNVNVVHFRDTFDLRKTIFYLVDIQMCWGCFKN